MPRRAMRRSPAGWLLLMVALLSVPTGAARAVEDIIALPVMPEAPALSLPQWPRGRLDLAAYRGRLLLVSFWAVWCRPCREEFPAMARAYQALREEGVAMVAVNSGDSPEAVERFLRDHPLPFPVLLDRDSAAAGEWQVQGLPTTYVVTPDGRIYGGAIGARAWDSPRMLASVRELARRLRGAEARP